ncbi:hypothetical protein GCM10027423_07870 [Spirosoma arcticum]
MALYNTGADVHHGIDCPYKPSKKYFLPMFQLYMPGITFDQLAFTESLYFINIQHIILDKLQHAHNEHINHRLVIYYFNKND